MATTNYTVSDVKGIQESFNNATPDAFMQYVDIPFFNIQSTTQHTMTFISTENISGTRALAELEAPDVNALQEGYSISLSDVRHGNSINVSSTDRQRMRDGTVKVEEYLMRQSTLVLNDVRYYFANALCDMYNNGFATTYHAAPDAVALFGTHSWNTSGSTSWNNSATAALSNSSVAAAMKFGGAFTDGSGKAMPQTYDSIMVKLGSSAAKAAKENFAANISPVAVGDVNIYQGEFTIYEVPLLTSDTAWYMMDTKKNPSPVFAGVTKFPTMEDPNRGLNLADTIAIEDFWKLGINDMPFNLYGSTGAA